MKAQTPEGSVILGTLNVALERDAYTPTERGPAAPFRKRLNLEIVFERARLLLHLYHIMEVNPVRSPGANHDGARGFAAFVASPATQKVVAAFGADRFGQSFFFRAAGGVESGFSGPGDD